MPPRRIRLGIMDETPGVSCAGMSLRGQRLLLAAVALAGVLLAGIGFLGVAEGLLYLAPALVLALPLLAGRYLGAERLSRIAKTRSRHRRRAAASPRAPLVWGHVLPRGGLLIAASLAVRPPPRVLSHH
jgi:hypothetical protein